MNFFSKNTLWQTLKRHRVSPKKKLGQNFLIDRGVAKKIVKAANLHSKDIVLEIGPGIGSLTAELSLKVKRVIAVEKDPGMVIILKETIKNFKNVKIIQGDILKINTKYKIRNTKYKIVANLPYYIVSPVIRKFLESSNPPKLMVLMVQKEVAQRICARPPHMNLLAVSVQFYVHPVSPSSFWKRTGSNGAKPKIISYVSKKSFWPQPKVDSAIIKIIPKRILQRPGLGKLFFKIVKAGFSQPRKQITNNLSKILEVDQKKIKGWLLKNKIQPSMRAEALDIENWIRLTKTFYLLEN